jgi:acetolactate synthase-1/2/3 large subunit
MIDLYDFIQALNEASSPKDIINPSASGMAANVILQTWKVKKGQRFVTNFVLGEMGAGLPYSIGAALATERRILQIEGDGGFQLNIQELETVKRLNLPIIIFIINNNGYASIRQSQQKNFGRLTGADPSSGFTMPSLRSIASAYGLPYVQIDRYDGSFIRIDTCMGSDPIICEVHVNPDQEYHHRVGSKLVDGVMTSGRLEDV